ncbi:MAG TPA: polysaccharide deacetylase family protein [Polyangia bacterium]
MPRTTKTPSSCCSSWPDQRATLVPPGAGRRSARAWARASLSLTVLGGVVAGATGSARAFAPTAPLVAAAASETEAAAGAPRIIITRFDNAQKRVSLTFDACAIRTKGYGFDRAVYEILRREKVPATIFTSGRWVEFHPDVMAELATDPLIEFGNHSYDHPHMARLSTARMDAQLDQTEAALARYGKRSVAFRPPFGEYSAHLIDVVHAHGMQAVLWDVVSGDPAKATTTEEIIDVVNRETRGGSIVIFHINGRGWKTAEALPTVIQNLRARGFNLVPLSSLLGPATGETPGMPPGETSSPKPPTARSALGPLISVPAPVGPGMTRFAAPGPVPCEAPPLEERIFPGRAPDMPVGEEAWTR